MHDVVCVRQDVVLRVVLTSASAHGGRAGAAGSRGKEEVWSVPPPGCPSRKSVSGGFFGQSIRLLSVTYNSHFIGQIDDLRIHEGLITRM